MRTRKVQGGNERQVLIGMIVSRTVLGAVSSKWQTGMFSSRWANLIAGWCVKHYQQYKRPPGKDIISLFDDWSDSAERDRETVQLVDKFLSSLSGEYSRQKKDLNVEYTLDLASAYFTKVKQKELLDKIAAAIEDNELEEADKLFHTYSKIDVGNSEGTDLFADAEGMQAAFDAKSEPLIEYEHGLGIFYADALERDGFVAFMGMEKVGKTFALMDVAWNAVMQDRKVAFFEVGDLSLHQVRRRFGVRVAGIPMKPCVVKYPTHLTIEDDGPYTMHDEIKYKKGLDYESAWKAIRKVAKLNMLAPDALRISVHPNDSISMYGVVSILDNWERQGWVPDVVVIDYADILAPMKGNIDSRDQINSTWKAMRALSQQRHCLVVTATQVKASAYDDETLTKAHFSEDKRKFAHVTAMYGINQNAKDKKAGVLRYNTIVLRENAFHEDDYCYVAPCLEVGQPAVLSVMQ